MKLLLLLSVLLSLNVQAKHMIKLEFDSLEESKKWIVWYLDQGGEEASGFIVENWNIDVMSLKTDIEADEWADRCQNRCLGSKPSHADLSYKKRQNKN